MAGSSALCQIGLELSCDPDCPNERLLHAEPVVFPCRPSGVADSGLPAGGAYPYLPRRSNLLWSPHDIDGDADTLEEKENG